MDMTMKEFLSFCKEHCPIEIYDFFCDMPCIVTLWSYDLLKYVAQKEIDNDKFVVAKCLCDALMDGYDYYAWCYDLGALREPVGIESPEDFWREFKFYCNDYNSKNEPDWGEEDEEEE